jgi:hypothetical protein
MRVSSELCLIAMTRQLSLPTVSAFRMQHWLYSGSDLP